MSMHVYRPEAQQTSSPRAARRVGLACWGVPLLALVACGDGAANGSGRVRVQLEAEETITRGLDTGSADEDTRDYAVRYTKYLVAVGDVALARDGETAFEDELVYIADLKQVGSEGVELARFDDIAAGQWDRFSFATPAARAGAIALDGVAEADRDLMIEHGWTYWIEGYVERPEAEGGPVEFVIQTAVDTRFDRCRLDDEPGLAVVESGTASATITLHGDHLWFDAFPSGSEGVIERRAAWMVAADVDGDGQVVTEDLAALDATTLFTSQLGYDLGGNPLGADYPIETALDFVRAQLATQGHFRGEGECTWEFLGVEGDHDHAQE